MQDRVVTWEDGRGDEYSTAMLAFETLEDREIILTRHPVSGDFRVIEVTDENSDGFYGQPVER